MYTPDTDVHVKCCNCLKPLYIHRHTYSSGQSYPYAKSVYLRPYEDSGRTLYGTWAGHASTRPMLPMLLLLLLLLLLCVATSALSCLCVYV